MLSLVFFEVELDISEERLEEKARELDDEIALPLIFDGFLVPYRPSAILTSLLKSVKGAASHSALQALESSPPLFTRLQTGAIRLNNELLTT